MSKLMGLRSLVFNEPHLVTPAYAETVLAVLSDKLGISEGLYEIQNDPKEAREDMLQEGGVYVLPIVGSMVHRGGMLDALSGINSYEGLQAKLEEALNDNSVKSILLDMDSPGGTVAGAFDLRDFILSAREHKPIYALARDTMASAAYLIGSACDKVYTTQTGSLGSIGVVAMHVDQSEANAKQGVKPTFIYAGDYKVAGNGHAPLDEKSLGYLQESVNDSYELFVNAVADARGIDSQVIRDTEARVYRGEKAVAIGLADGVRSFDATIQELANVSPKRVQSNSMKGNLRMDHEEMEKLQADLAQTSADLEKTKGNLEFLQGALIKEGYTITAEGLVKAKEPEMIEVAGVLTDKASLPEHVVAALEEAVKEKADAALTERASAELPHFKGEAAKALLSAVETLGEEEKAAAMEALKAADVNLSELMTETGETKVESGFETASEKLDAAIEAYASKHNVPKFKATAAVLETAEGRELHKQAAKERK